MTPPPASPGTRGELRPVGVGVGVACTTVLLLTQAVRHGWLGPDVGSGAEFCELWHDGPLKQPVNTLSNLGFVAVGLAIAWAARRPEARGEGPLRRTTTVTLLVTVVVLLGPASAAMHATGTQVGRSLDLLSMHLVAGFAAAVAVVRLTGATHRLLAWFLAFVLVAQSAALVPGGVPVVRQPENLTFIALLLVVVVLESRAHRTGRSPTRTDRRWLAAALGTLALGFTLWNLDLHGWCRPDSWLQLHAVWHLLCALACWFLFRFYASERRSTPPTGGPATVTAALAE